MFPVYKNGYLITFANYGIHCENYIHVNVEITVIVDLKNVIS